MLSFAILKRDTREVVGQVTRVLVAAPGNWLRRASPGNTGGANVGILRPMPIREDLRALLNGAHYGYCAGAVAAHRLGNTR